MSISGIFLWIFFWIIVNDGWLTTPSEMKLWPRRGLLPICSVLRVFRHRPIPGVPSVPVVRTHASLVIFSKFPIKFGCLPQQLYRSCQSDASSCPSPRPSGSSTKPVITGQTWVSSNPGNIRLQTDYVGEATLLSNSASQFLLHRAGLVGIILHIDMINSP